MAAPIDFIWNTFTYKHPAVFTVWKRKSNIVDSSSKIYSKAELVKMFNEACMFLEPVFMTYLQAESCILQPLLYKLKSQQKHWKWFSLLEKIQKCLCRALAINLHGLFKTVLSFCDVKKDLSDMEQVPSETSTKLILEEIVGLSKLCACILELSEHTFPLIVGNLQIGEFVVQNLLFAAIISRIWVLVRGTLVKLFAWYELLRGFGIQNKKSKYYTMFKDLPVCLSKWIDLDVASLKIRNKKVSVKSKEDTLSKMFGSWQKSPPESSDNLIGQSKSNKEDLYTAIEACSEMDLGESVAIVDASAVPKKKKKKEKKVLSCQDGDKSDNDEEVMSVEEIVVPIPKRKKNKKRKHSSDACCNDAIGDKLDNTEQLQGRQHANTTEDRVDTDVKKVSLLNEDNSDKNIEVKFEIEESNPKDRVDKMKRNKNDSSKLYENKHIVVNFKNEEKPNKNRGNSVEKITDKSNPKDKENKRDEDIVDIAVKKKKKKKDKALYDAVDKGKHQKSMLYKDEFLHNVVKQRKRTKEVDVFNAEEHRTEDKVDNALTKNQKTLLYNEVEELNLTDYKVDTTSDIKNEKSNKFNLLEVGKKGKKAKRKKEALVCSDSETSQRVFLHTVDASLQSNTLIIDATKKKKKKKRVEEIEISTAVERKRKKKCVAITMETDYESEKTKKSRVMFKSDEDELDDIFSCLDTCS